MVSQSRSTGSGALIKPVIGRLPLTPQGEVVQVIDCISPNINNIVGYINGKPYTGPYHIMSNGVKMTGASHTGNDVIIYDTPQESFRSARSVGITTMMTTPTTTITQGEVIGEITMPDTSTSTYTPPSDPPTSSPPSGGGGY